MADGGWNAAHRQARMRGKRVERSATNSTSSSRGSAPSVVVLGGGLSGIAAAYTAGPRRAPRRDAHRARRDASAAWPGSFEREGHFYPLGYHHILHRDRTLLYLPRSDRRPAGGALAPDPDALPPGRRDSTSWGRPGGFSRFPMRLLDKAAVRPPHAQGVRKRDWSDWQDRSAAELVDALGRPGRARGAVRATHPAQVRAALQRGQRRLAGRAAPLTARARLLWATSRAPTGPRCSATGWPGCWSEAGVRVRLRHPGRPGSRRGGPGASRPSWRAVSAFERRPFVSTVPTEVYLRLVPGDDDPELDRHPVFRAHLGDLRDATAGPAGAYWTNLASLGPHGGRDLSAQRAQPTIGRPGDTCVNFVTHLRGRDRPLFHEPDEQLSARYRDGLPRGVRLRAGARSGPTSRGCRCIRRSSTRLSATRRCAARPGERVFRRQLPHLPLDRLHRHGAAVGRRDGRAPSLLASGADAICRLRRPLPPRGGCRVADTHECRGRLTLAVDRDRSRGRCARCGPTSGSRTCSSSCRSCWTTGCRARSMLRGARRLRGVLSCRLGRLHPQRPAGPGGRSQPPHQAPSSLRLGSPAPRGRAYVLAPLLC